MNRLSSTLALSLILLAQTGLLPAQETAAPATNAPATPAVAPADMPVDIAKTDYLSEVVRHLYRWYMDESDVEQIATQPQVIFWVRNLSPALDAGDRSRYAEITLPQVGVTVHVKKPDYTIDELGLVVTSATFRITNVAKGPALSDAEMPADATRVAIDMKEMRDFLFRTRDQRDYPAPELIERMRAALRAKFEKGDETGVTAPTTPQTIHIAPLSPVANEVWVLWEDRQMLIRYASDIDLSNPLMWEHENLATRVYDINKQVIVSREEAPGSNKFLTRDEVGRALYNCVILGKRLTITPPAAGKTTEKDGK